MPKKSIPQKSKTPKQSLTIRVADEDRENIAWLRSALADDKRPELNVTQVIVSALKIAKKSLAENAQ